MQLVYRPRINSIIAALLKSILRENLLLSNHLKVNVIHPGVTVPVGDEIVCISSRLSTTVVAPTNSQFIIDLYDMLWLN